MTNEISKQQLVILMRSGARVWVDEHKAKKLANDLSQGLIKGFAKIDGELINTVDISGIYTPYVIDELTHIKNGEWKCSHKNWIPRYKKCQCNLKPEYRNY